MYKNNLYKNLKMKDFIKLTIFFIFPLLTVYGIDAEFKNEKIIQTIKLNSTTFISLLNYYKNENYLYLSFDFDNYNKVSMKKNVAFFYIMTDQQYYSNSDLKNSITHSYLEKEISTISYSFITENEKKLNWKKSKIVIKESLLLNLNTTKYYLEINREKEDEDKKSLIIKIPIFEKRGILFIQHIFSLPKIKKNEKYPFNQNADKGHIDQLEIDSKERNESTINIPIIQKRYDNFSKYRDMNKNWKNNRNRYHNKYNNYKKFEIEKNNWKFGLGGFLLFIWAPLFILYFFINRRKKSFTLEIHNSENNLIYQNI